MITPCSSSTLRDNSLRRLISMDSTVNMANHTMNVVRAIDRDVCKITTFRNKTDYMRCPFFNI